MFLSELFKDFCLPCLRTSSVSLIPLSTLLSKDCLDVDYFFWILLNTYAHT